MFVGKWVRMEIDRNTFGRTVDPNLLQLLREVQVCKLLAISHATWWRWVKANPELLKPIRLGRNSTRWRASSVLAFVEQAEQRGAKAQTPKDGTGA